MGKKNYVLMKFFQNEDFKTQFLNGKIYCNPAALYRKLEKNGIGDRCESVIFSHYKGSEQFDGIKLTMGLGSEFYKNEMNIYDYEINKLTICNKSVYLFVLISSVLNYVLNSSEKSLGCYQFPTRH